MRIDGPQITGSFNLNGDTVADLDVFATTSSLNTYTSSIGTTMGHVNTATHSLNTFTSSATTKLNSIEGVTGSYATTGSNLFKGNQTISGSLLPAVDNTYDLGSVTHQFRDLYLSSASLYIDGTKVLGSTAQELTITTDTGQSFKILEAGSDTITLQSGDGNVTLTSSGQGDIVLDPTTGIIGLKGTVSVYTGNKIVSSDGNSIQFGNGIAVTGSIVSTTTSLVSGSSQITYSGLSGVPSDIISGSGQLTTLGIATTGSNTFNGNLTVTGFIDTQELRTTYISSSILYRSGSTKFGDELTDTHSFTGSILISGSISVPGSNLVSGSSQILNGSGVFSGSAQLPSGIVSSSAQTIANLPSGTVSGSAQTIANLPSGTVSGSSQVSFTGTTGYSTYINQAVLTTSSPTFAGLTNNSTYSQSTTSTQPVMIYGDSGDTNGLFRIQMDSISDSFGTGARTFLGDGGIDIFLGTSNSSYTPGNTYIALNHGGEISMGAGSATKHLILSTSGYLGVNVNPTQRLHLYDASPTNGILAKLQSGAVTGWLQLTSTGTSWQIGATATGLQFWSDNETSTKLTVLTGGSILMNQDVAIRAGASQNWILGQDSGTNVIHMGSTGVANDIRFDSSTGSGIVMIKSNGNLGVGFTTVTNKLQVAGEITTHAGTNTQFYAYMNYLGTTYNLGPGETSDNIDFKIVGGSTFATGGNFRWFTQPGGTTPTERFRLTPTGPAYFTNKLTVGGTGNYSSATLSVEGPVRANRSIYNWYQSGTNSWDGYQYLHLKTTLWGGGGGSNSQPTMSMFSAKLYSYSSAYIREGNLAFHNWSGTIYSQVTTGTIWYGAYVSSDGYVTLILSLGGGSYHGVHIDWHQSFGYGFQDRYVSATAYTNTASSLY